MTDATQQQEDTTAAPEAAEDEAALWTQLEQEEAGNSPDAGNDDTGPSDEDRQAADRAEDAAAAEQETTDSAADADADTTGTNTEDQGTEPGGEQPSGQKPDRQQTQADIWANATPEQKAEYERLAEDRRRLGREHATLRQTLGRYKAELAQATTSPARPDGDASDVSRETSEPTAGSIEAYLASDGFKSFKEEYPDVAGPMEDALRLQQADLTRVNKEMSAISNDRRQAALDEQGALLSERHPDWQQTVTENQDQFKDWLDHQPRHIREAAHRNAEQVVDAEEAADVVGRFKAFLTAQQGEQGNGEGPNAADERPASGQGTGSNQAQPPLSDKRKRQLESATTSRSRTPSAGIGIPEDGDPEQIWKQMDRAGL